jgi:hydroxypyruvate isomerase
MITDFSLAACPEMIFTELPITARVQRIDDLGFHFSSGDLGLDQTRHRLEAFASHDSELALERFRAPFSPLSVSHPKTDN